jgi:hypothetical protein
MKQIKLDINSRLEYMMGGPYLFTFMPMIMRAEMVSATCIIISAVVCCVVSPKVSWTVAIKVAWLNQKKLNKKQTG